jgi:hypothetical protein
MTSAEAPFLPFAGELVRLFRSAASHLAAAGQSGGAKLCRMCPDKGGYIAGRYRPRLAWPAIRFSCNSNRSRGDISVGPRWALVVSQAPTPVNGWLRIPWWPDWSDRPVNYIVTHSEVVKLEAV